MGSSEKDKDKPAKEREIHKESKSTPITTQEQPSTISPGTVNPDWSGFQAYSPVPPHGFLASSPQAHPYMWGVQPVMPPYGTPPHPYVAMYPHGGIYPHPSMPVGPYPFSPFAVPSPNGVVEASGNTLGSLDGDGKPSEVKEKLPIKRLRGSLGSLNMITGKNNELGRTSGPSANGTCSKSATSASDGTSEGSDGNSENDSDLQLKSGSGQDSLEGEANQNGGSNIPRSKVNRSKAILPTPPVISPTTNLNIGMDYWVSPTSSALRGKAPSTPVPGGMSGSRDGTRSQLWPQDERDLKRQRRKQSNRESARRSRLRKQAECDELAIRAEALREENASLTSEVNRMRSEYEQLLLENSSLKERLEENPRNEDSRSGPNDNKESELTPEGI